MMDTLSFSLGITAPIFLVLCLGIVLKRKKIINNEFAKMGSDLAFKVTLPCLMFIKLVDTNFHHIPVALVSYAAVATVCVFFLLEYFITPNLAAEDRSAFVQGSFRSNMGIIGLAFVLNAYGDAALATASIYLALITILYNVLAMVTLSRHLEQAKSMSLKSVLLPLFKNPIILSIATAIAVSLSGLHVPNVLRHSAEYIASMTLPMALLCTGAAIRWRDFKTSSALYWASFAKLVWTPLLITAGAIALGFRGQDLAVLFLLCSAPTAAASYPMIRALGGNHYLAAAIIAVTSLGSIVTVTLGLLILKLTGLI